MEAQEARRQSALRRAEDGRSHNCARLDRGELPQFLVGDLVLVAQVRNAGPHAKLISRWTGPWRVVSDKREHVYEVQHPFTGETRYAHVAHLRPYADKDLDVTSA